MPNIHEDLVEEAPLSDKGRRILTWIAEHPLDLDHDAAEAANEPYWEYIYQAARALGIGRPRFEEYLNYAVQEILEDQERAKQRHGEG